MKLDFDLGNTRLKWQLQTAAGSEFGAAAWQDFVASSEALNRLLASVNKLNADGIEALDVCVSSVAGVQTEELFNLWVQDKLVVQPRYIHVEKQFAGLRVAYEDVSRLGVDRWLAMLAARAQHQVCNVVIDAGSAITVDYVSPQGEHEGGLIVPGLPLVSRAMSSGTRNLKPESLTLTQYWQPGCDTVSGIAQGLSAMYAGLVKETLGYYIKKADALGAALHVSLSGGDARTFAPWCEGMLQAGQLTINEFLVLDGIEVWREHQQHQTK